VKGIEPSNAVWQIAVLPLQSFSTSTLTCPKSSRYERTRELRSRLAAFPVQAHDQAVSKPVEQKPEIILGQIFSGPQFNKPPANEPLALWTFEPKTSGPKGPRQKATRSMPYGPFGATAKIFRDRGVRFATHGVTLWSLVLTAGTRLCG
jgi:hypothetical protein